MGGGAVGGARDIALDGQAARNVNADGDATGAVLAQSQVSVSQSVITELIPLSTRSLYTL